MYNHNQKETETNRKNAPAPSREARADNLEAGGLEKGSTEGTTKSCGVPKASRLKKPSDREKRESGTGKARGKRGETETKKSRTGEREVKMPRLKKLLNRLIEWLKEHEISAEDIADCIDYITK